MPTQAETSGAPSTQVDLDTRVVPASYRLPTTLAERSKRFTVRFLADTTLWIEIAGYQCTVILGPHSACILDPLDERRAAEVVRIVRTHFNLGVSAVAYSHWHSDHIGGAALVRERGGHASTFRVLATVDCAHEVQARGKFPTPTETLHAGTPASFEGIEIVPHQVGGHSTDHTAFLLPAQQVLHAVDLVHPGQSEYFSFGGAPDIASYERALERIAALEWRVLTAGHGQLGWPEDVALSRRFVSALRREVTEALRTNEAAPPPHATVPLEAIARQRGAVIDALRPRLLAEWAPQLTGLDFSLDSLITSMIESVQHHE